MTEELIKAVVSNLTSFVVLGICGWLAAQYKENRERVERTEEENRIIRNGLRVSIKRDIITDSSFYLERGWVELHLKDDLLEAYAAYHALGGNGSVHDLVEQVKALPNMPPKLG